MNEITGSCIDGGGRYALVCGRFNRFITDRLVQGAADVLLRHGVAAAAIDCIWVPGAFEIPQAVSRVLAAKRYQAVITLGAVVRGATPHFDYVAGECAAGIARLSLEAEIPVVFGVLTVDTLEQAVERAGAKAGNKGADAALAALEMVSLLQQL